MTVPHFNRTSLLSNETTGNTDLAEALAEWKHRLDLLGPFAPPETLQKLLDSVPAPAFRDARFLAGRLAGLAGNLGEIAPGRTSRGPVFMCGFVCGLRQAIRQRFGE